MSTGKIKDITGSSCHELRRSFCSYWHPKIMSQHCHGEIRHLKELFLSHRNKMNKGKVWHSLIIPWLYQDIDIVLWTEFHNWMCDLNHTTTEVLLTVAGDARIVWAICPEASTLPCTR